VPVATDIIPVAISVQVRKARDVLFNRAVLIAHRAPVRVVIVRIIQVGVVVVIAPIIGIRIAIAIIVVDDAATHTRIDLRNQRLVDRRGSKRQQLPSAALARSSNSNHLGQPAQHRHQRIAISYSHLVQARPDEVDSAIWCPDFA